MNALLVALGLEAWKPLLGALLLPPLPLLLLVLAGAWQLPRRRALGWALLLPGLLGVWASCTTAVGGALIDRLTRPPPPLDIKHLARQAGAPRTAIVVLGAGRRLEAPEYGAPELKPMTIERLRYGLWLARQTGLPVAYSGGVGLGSPPGPTEAEIARRIAARDFGVPLRWAEDRSRDTNENALRSVAMLRAEGIERIVVVTHGFHQARALAAFGRAIERERATISLLAAPMGLHSRGALELHDWLPGAEGLTLTRLALHEWLGRIGGA